MQARAGRATSKGTRRFAERALSTGHVHAGHFRDAPGKLTLSSIGLGTYIGRPDAPTDHAVEEAARVALSSRRVNVLDTAINYRFQRAERSLGRALGSLIDAGTLGRDEVFVASKAGYLAPDSESPGTPQEWVERELVAAGHLRADDIVDGSHAMSPEYLRDQLRRSQANLGLETIDLYYLHNAPDAQLPAVGRPEFERRLTAAFATLEAARTAGAIAFYGLATWDCLRAARSDPGYFALEEAVAIARGVGGDDHGLRFVQFPFNLAMPEAALARNQPVGSERLSLFDAAQRLGLGCFTSVPLLQGQILRAGPALDGLSAAQTAIQLARSAPGTIGPLVGQKRPEHLSEDLAVASSTPWEAERFTAVLRGPRAAPRARPG